MDHLVNHSCRRLSMSDRNLRVLFHFCGFLSDRGWQYRPTIELRRLGPLASLFINLPNILPFLYYLLPLIFLFVSSCNKFVINHNH